MHDAVERMRKSNADRLKTFKKWQRAWDTLARERSTGKADPAVLKQCVAQLQGWADASPEFRNEWAELQTSVGTSYRDLVRRYESELRQACKQKSLNLEGQFPSFIVEGVIKVSLDETHNKAAVNGKKVPTLSLPAVTTAILTEHGRLWGRQFDAPAFTSRLKAAYLAVCKTKGTSFGEYVSLRDVYQELKSSDKEYSTDLFAADLSRLMESRGTGGGPKPDLAPIRNPQQAFYLYDRGVQSGRYLGLIRFRKEQ